MSLREELEKLARAYVDVRDDDLPIRANALVIAAANLALEAAARECVNEALRYSYDEDTASRSTTARLRSVR